MMLFDALYLTPNVLWRRVTIPETKNTVDIIVPFPGSSSSIHRAGAMMNGVEIAPPNIVRYC